jgi:hypothetical protein
MDHFAYPTLGDFVEKHLRYAHWEAAVGPQTSATTNDGSAIGRTLSGRRTLKTWGRRIPFPHWFRFAYHYFIRAGFLDGWHGYIFCHLLAEYEFWVWIRRMELRQQAAVTQAPNSGLGSAIPRRTVSVRRGSAIRQWSELTSGLARTIRGPNDRAGLPATIVHGATGRVTTEQAATTAPRPTVTPGPT